MVSKVESVPGLRASNAYLFTSSSGQVALLDSGMPGNAKKIADYIVSTGKDPKSISYILLTHPDIDHSGSVWELKEKYTIGAKVAIHKDDALRLAGEMKLKEVKGAAGMMMGMLSPFMRFHPVTPDILLQDQQTIASLLVIHTPGHTQGSVCFYDRESKLLFSGDTIIVNKNGKPVYSGSSMSYDLSMTRKSVEAKLQDLDYEALYPGHGPAIKSNAAEKVRGLIGSQH